MKQAEIDARPTRLERLAASERRAEIGEEFFRRPWLFALARCLFQDLHYFIQKRGASRKK